MWTSSSQSVPSSSVFLSPGFMPRRLTFSGSSGELSFGARHGARTDDWQILYRPQVSTLHINVLQLLGEAQGLQVCAAEECSAEPGIKPMVSDSFPLASFRWALWTAFGSGIGSLSSTGSTQRSSYNDTWLLLRLSPGLWLLCPELCFRLPAVPPDMTYWIQLNLEMASEKEILISPVTQAKPKITCRLRASAKQMWNYYPQVAGNVAQQVLWRMCVKDNSLFIHQIHWTYVLKNGKTYLCQAELLMTQLQIYVPLNQSMPNLFNNSCSCFLLFMEKVEKMQRTINYYMHASRIKNFAHHL